MTSTTTHYGYTLYDRVADSGSSFLNFRGDIAGVGEDSNFEKVDVDLKDIQDSIDGLETRNYIVRVPITYSAPNQYIATVAEMPAAPYDDGTMIVVIPNKTNDGTTLLNINGDGNETLVKINSTGSAVNLTAGDLVIKREHLFAYDGANWVWINATSYDQINIPGNIGEILTISSASGLVSSGSLLSDLAPSTGSYIVAALNSSLKNELLLTAGSYISINANTNASSITITGSPTQLAIDPTPKLSAGLNLQGYRIFTSSGSIILQLPDDTGATNVKILDSGSTIIYSVDSDGNVIAAGNVNCQQSLTVGGNINVSGSVMAGGNIGVSGCAVVLGGLIYNNDAGVINVSASALTLVDSGRTYIRVDTDNGIIAFAPLKQIHPPAGMMAGTVITLAANDSNRTIELQRNAGGSVQGKMYWNSLISGSVIVAGGSGSAFSLDNSRDIAQFMLQGSPPTTYWWGGVNLQDNAV
jgi:filamentous hemagglutinin